MATCYVRLVDVYEYSWQGVGEQGPQVPARGRCREEKSRQAQHGSTSQLDCAFGLSSGAAHDTYTKCIAPKGCNPGCDCVLVRGVGSIPLNALDTPRMRSRPAHSAESETSGTESESHQDRA